LETHYGYEGWSTSLTDKQKAKKKKKNDDTWNHLVMACKNKPFHLITCERESNAFKGWERLKKEYDPTTEEDN
jgi:peroxiredoxin family protein